ncbi:MAG: hypothetical protein WC828_04030 [Thermoleophilia bacterium]
MSIGDWIFIGAVCLSPVPMITLVFLQLVGSRDHGGASGSAHLFEEKIPPGPVSLSICRIPVRQTGNIDDRAPDSSVSLSWRHTA